MVDFTVSADQQLLLDAVERFVRQELAPNIRPAEHDRRPADVVVERYEALGLMNLEDPDSGLGLLSRCLVNEALGRGDPGAALALDRLGHANAALRQVGGAELIDAILMDRRRRAWCVVPEDGRLTVDDRSAHGIVHFAPAGVTDLCLLLPDGIALVREGFREEPVRGAGLRAAAPVRLHLDHAPVAARAGIEPGPALAAARLWIASLLLGVLEAASSYARQYAMERVAFGRPIAHHQALTFLLVDMNTAVAGTRLLVHDAAWRFDAGHPADEAAATAFAEAVDRSTFVGPGGVQVLGGLGFMQDYPVEKYMRESRALGLLLGGIDRARADALRDAGVSLMAGGLF